ncbi:TPA: hypothetical protein ACSP2Y_002658 [Aeromonas veronii]
MAATASNGIRLSKSGAKAGLVVDGDFDAGWRGRRLALSAAKPNMRRKTNPPASNRGDGNNRITPNYPIIAFELFHGKRWAAFSTNLRFGQYTRYVL